MRQVRERMRSGVVSGLVCLAVVLVMAGQGEAAVKKNALVIGNGAYRNIVPLKNPVNDARDMKAALERIGFEVILKVDAGRSEIREAVRTFGDRIQRGGVGLFYYAGHGIQVDGVNYIIPLGVDIKRVYDVEDQALRMNYVLGAMEAANNQLNIVILDACRDNPFRSIGSFRGESAGLARMDAPTGTIVAYATAPGQKAEDGTGRNGTYTASLLKHLTRPGLSIQDMLNNTGLEVMKQTRSAQVPWISATPVPRFFLAGGAPEDQNLMPVQPQPAAQSAQSVPQANMTPQSDAGSYEIIFWESIKDSGNADAFKAYLAQYPEGAFAPLARIKLQQSAPEKETAAPWPVSKETITTQLASIDPKEKDPDIVATDGHYIKYKNGIVYDTQTALEWVAFPKVNLLSGAAKRWVSKLTIDGGGWRMPSEDELKSLYQNGKGTRNMTRLIETKAWCFFSRDSESWHWKGFDFQSFQQFGFHPGEASGSSYRYLNYGIAFSALAVRPRK